MEAAIVSIQYTDTVGLATGSASSLIKNLAAQIQKVWFLKTWPNLDYLGVVWWHNR